MLKDHKYKHHEHEALKANTDFKNLIKVLHQFVSLFYYLKHPHHSCHSDNFIKFPDSSNSRHTSEVTVHKDNIEWDYRYDINEKPGLRILFENSLIEF